MSGYKPADELVDLTWLKQLEVDSQDALPFPAPVIETKPLPGSAESTAVSGESEAADTAS